MISTITTDRKAIAATRRHCPSPDKLPKLNHHTNGSSPSSSRYQALLKASIVRQVTRVAPVASTGAAQPYETARKAYQYQRGSATRSASNEPKCVARVQLAVQSVPELRPNRAAWTAPFDSVLSRFGSLPQMS